MSPRRCSASAAGGAAGAPRQCSTSATAVTSTSSAAAGCRPRGARWSGWAAPSWSSPATSTGRHGEAARRSRRRWRWRPARPGGRRLGGSPAARSHRPRRAGSRGSAPRSRPFGPNVRSRLHWGMIHELVTALETQPIEAFVGLAAPLPGAAWLVPGRRSRDRAGRGQAIAVQALRWPARARRAGRPPRRRAARARHRAQHRVRSAGGRAAAGHCVTSSAASDPTTGAPFTNWTVDSCH